MTGDFLTLKEAAAYVGMNRVKFSRAVKRLRLPSTTSPHDGRIRWFKRADLENWKHAPRVGEGSID